ncbi:MAG: hypothetical protein IPG93_05260 [Burkholderiales bacterium]|nr:hypothetical protein [Burkholderiales bacterium]
MQAIAAEVKTTIATFIVADEWKVIAGSNADEFALRSAARPIEVNVLTQRAPKITERNLEAAASHLLQAALETHAQSARDRKLALLSVESNVSVGSHEAFGEFMGSDNTGRRFRQLVIARPGQILALYADSKILSHEELLTVISEIVRSIKNEP